MSPDHQYAAIRQLRGEVIEPQQLFIAGEWRAGRGSVLPVISPIDGARLTTLQSADVSDVDDAVAAARKAYEAGSWSRASPSARRQVLLRLADLIESNALGLAVRGVRENGTEISMALRAEPGSAAATGPFVSTPSPTEQYINRVLFRITWAGAFFLGTALFGLLLGLVLTATAALPAVVGRQVSDRDLAEVLSARAGVSCG